MTGNTDDLDMPAGRSDGGGTGRTAATRSAALHASSAETRTTVGRFALDSGLRLCGLGHDSLRGFRGRGTVKHAAAATRKRQGGELMRKVHGRVLVGGSVGRRLLCETTVGSGQTPHALCTRCSTER